MSSVPPATVTDHDHDGLLPRSRSGGAAAAGELLTVTRAELPALGQREQLLGAGVAAFGAHRRAYFGV